MIKWSPPPFHSSLIEQLDLVPRSQVAGLHFYGPRTGHTHDKTSAPIGEEVQFPTLLGNYDRPTDRLIIEQTNWSINPTTDQRTDWRVHREVTLPNSVYFSIMQCLQLPIPRYGVCLNFYRGVERRGSTPQAANKRESWTRGTDRSTDSAFSR